MQHDIFIETVRQMREAQREYFSTKKTDWLIRSKALERAVDRMIKEHDSKQGSLLDGQDIDPGDRRGAFRND